MAGAVAFQPDDSTGHVSCHRNASAPSEGSARPRPRARPTLGNSAALAQQARKPTPRRAPWHAIGSNRRLQTGQNHAGPHGYSTPDRHPRAWKAPARRFFDIRKTFSHWRASPQPRHRPGQHLQPGHQIALVGILGEIVADPADRRHEQHRHRHMHRHVGRVMQGTRLHHPPLARRHRLGRGLQRPAQPRVHRHRLQPQHRPETQLQPPPLPPWRG